MAVVSAVASRKVGCDTAKGWLQNMLVLVFSTTHVSLLSLSVNKAGKVKANMINKLAVVCSVTL